MKKTALLLASLALSLTPAAQAAERVPGTWTYYSASSDPITDVNTGMVIVDEVNDLTGRTSLTFKCADGSEPGLWSVLDSKNPLLDPENLLLPTATVRVGSSAPQFIYGDALYPTTLHGETHPSAVGFPEGITREMAAGLFRGERVVIRLDRDPSVGRQTLTYTFPADGFKVAWNAVNRCQQGQGTPAAAPVGRVSAPGGTRSGEAPKFTQWYFTTCTDTASGAVRTQLRAGQTHRCQLVIETVPNGAKPVSATFTYELEYVEAGRSGKLQLNTRDVWQAGGSGPILHRTEGNRLIFNLPLNVRARPERRYTSINVTANLSFDNGSSKKVYEKLPVLP
ncbi:hypothetical protein GCM10017783_17300 [Deinococcus piscis]|uniref:Uncharacterized protein n=1 Tax=Deinococcus piscis TaxID=394230 RepID=A0ABQ3K626_9DEIO|nr:hypothetical protein [Deinococcus piscis]GHG05289.1 hypothetical protein GCM10017783_17300 [Deinococcus piscis]